MKIDLQNVKLRDVTKRWINEHYNVDSERKTRSVYRKHFLILDLEKFGPRDFSSIEELLEAVKQEAVAVEKNVYTIVNSEHEQPTNVIVTYGFEQDLSLESTGLLMHISYNRLETDDEVIDRLQENVKKTIRSNTTKQALAKKKINQLATERELYEKLKAKFEVD